MSSVDINDPRIKKVNFRKAGVGEISSLLDGLRGAAGYDTPEEAYFTLWEQKNECRLADAQLKLHIKEVKNLRLSDWDARIDPYVAITCGPVRLKTQVYKRSQDARMMEAFDIPLPPTFRDRSWELCLEVMDAQTNTPLGGVYLNLNEVFCEEESSTDFEPLCLEYDTVTLALQPVRFGEPASGTITISLRSTAAFPRVPLIRERRALTFDPDMTREAMLSLLNDEPREYMRKIEESVLQMEGVLPELLESVGGPYLLQMMLGESYNISSSSSSSSLATIFSSSSSSLFGGSGSTSSPSAPYLVGSSSSPTSSSPAPSSSSFVSSSLKNKSFFGKLGGGIGASVSVGGNSGFASGPMPAKAGKLLGLRDTCSMNDLPPEILERIFGHLPPWSALTVRRVNRLWDSLASPQLPDLWAMFHWYQKLAKAGNAVTDDLKTTFCTKAFRFMRECARIVQFTTALDYVLKTKGVNSLQPIERTIPVPITLGPIEAILSVTRILAYLDLWKGAVAAAINAQQRSDIYTNSVKQFQDLWNTHLPDDLKQSAAAMSFDDQVFWTQVHSWFTPSFTFTNTLRIAYATNVIAADLVPYFDILQSQLQRKLIPDDDGARLLCTHFVHLAILLKLLDRLPASVSSSSSSSKSKNKPLAVLKDYEHIMPAETTHLLVSQGLMKDTSYSKFL